MLWTLRWILVGILIGTGALFWWYPAPQLYHVYEPDWAADYERQYTPQTVVFGAYGAGREFLREIRAYQPLSEFILEQSQAGAHNPVSLAEWQEIQDNPSEYFLPTAWFSSDTRQGHLTYRDDFRLQHVRYRQLHPADYSRHAIPSELQFPIRTHAIPLFLLLGLSLILAQRLPADPRLAYGTLGAPTAVVSMLFILGLFLTAWPIVFRMMDTDMAMASLVLGALLALTMLVVLLVFGIQIRMLQLLVTGKDALLHWVYEPAEWDILAKQRRRETRRQQLRVWLIVSGVLLLMPVLLAVQTGSPAARAVAIAVAALSVLWRFLQLTVLWRRPSDVGVPPEAIIGTHGAYCDGELHRWGGFGARFQEAVIVDDPFPAMHISYSTLSGHSTGSRSIPVFYWQQHGLDIPIPAGRRDEAARAAQSLTEFLA